MNQVLIEKVRAAKRAYQVAEFEYDLRTDPTVEAYIRACDAQAAYYAAKCELYTAIDEEYGL